MELETRAPVRAHQGLREETGTVDRTGEGDRSPDREQATVGQGRDEIVLQVLVLGLLVALGRLVVPFPFVLRVRTVVGRQEDDGPQDDGSQDDRSQDDGSQGHHAEDRSEADYRPQDDGPEDDCAEDDAPEDDGAEDDGPEDDGPQGDHAPGDAAQDHGVPQDGHQAEDDDGSPHDAHSAPGRRQGRPRRHDGAEEARRREGRAGHRSQEWFDDGEIAHERPRDHVGPHRRREGWPRDCAQVLSLVAEDHVALAVVHLHVRAARSLSAART